MSKTAWTVIILVVVVALGAWLLSGGNSASAPEVNVDESPVEANEAGVESDTAVEDETTTPVDVDTSAETQY